MISSFKVGMKVATTILFTCLLVFFVYVSVDVVVNQISTEVIGYDVIDTEANDGKGEKIDFVEEKPAELGENRRYIAVYSEKPFAAKVAVWIIQAVCGLGVFFCTAGSVVAKTAAKDRNDVDFNRGTYDKWKGTKIGLFAAIPALIAYVVAVVVKLLPHSGAGEAYFWVYRWILTTPVKPFIDLFINRAINLNGAPLSGVLLSGVFVPLLALFCAVMYLICYNEDSVIAKVLYKSAQQDKSQRTVRR